MNYIGLDVHYRTSSICILNKNGKKIKQQTIRGGWSKLLEELQDAPKPFAICFEATCGYGHLYDRLSKVARRVVMAHPGKLRLIFRSARKNDRVDAEKLAKLLYLDEVPAAHVPSTNVRQWRELIEFRRRRVDKQTACKNQLRCLIRSHDMKAPRGLWTKNGLAWLASQQWPTASSQVRCEMLLDDYETNATQIKKITRVLDEIGKKHPGVSLLRTIPGVGARTSETIMAYIDDPQRFARSSQAACYFGLIPRQDASGGVNRLGHITKQGPPTARKYLVEAAWQAVRRSPKVRARYERILQDQPRRRKIALVAVARWLVQCMQAMLTTGEVWREAA
ncbi:MAG: IS110 family transposase [Phycisphaerae bacterium]|jgi:transposase|nr:IS110 family transposase [Phycisphaerae bacterium]MDP7287855.1 IS110 family transposase [Phycisphaerae bacterium]